MFVSSQSISPLSPQIRMIAILIFLRLLRICAGEGSGVRGFEASIFIIGMSWLKVISNSVIRKHSILF